MLLDNKNPSDLN